jgi:hypothetical protein
VLSCTQRFHLIQARNLRSPVGPSLKPENKAVGGPPPPKAFIAVDADAFDLAERTSSSCRSLIEILASRLVRRPDVEASPFALSHECATRLTHDPIPGTLGDLAYPACSRTRRPGPRPFAFALRRTRRIDPFARRCPRSAGPLRLTTAGEGDEADAGEEGEGRASHRTDPTIRPARGVRRPPANAQRERLRQRRSPDASMLRALRRPA